MSKKNTQNLRSFYALGQRVLKADTRNARSGRSIHNWNSLAKLRKQTGRRQNEISEARRFAGLYDTDQKFEWFCALGQNRGRPLTKSHALVISQIADGRRRNRLARACAEQSWSVRRLLREVRKLCPNRNYGGRQFSRPTSVDEAISEADRLAKQWIRWINVFKLPVGNAGVANITRENLPAAIHKTLNDVTDKMVKLHEQAQRQQNRKCNSSGTKRRVRRRRLR